MNNNKLIATGLLLCLCPIANADVVGATEAAILAKTIQQLSVMYQQLESMKQSYSKAVEQVTTSKNMLTKAESQLKSTNDLVKKNSGHYGFGSLNNSLKDLKSQQWSANKWSEALKDKSGSNQGQYRELIEAYKQNHKTLEVNEFKKGASGEVVENYENTIEVNRAAAVQSEYTFNEINKSLERIHELSAQIEKAENTKAAVDLNSRLLTEVAYLQTQNLKAQSLINQQLAQKQALELTERGNAAKYLAFDDNY